jgi:UDP-glucose 4-epimerase
LQGSAHQPLWILGQGGFLGTSIARIAVHAGFSIFQGHPIPWRDSSVRAEAMNQLAHRFAEFSTGGDPLIIWAAGADGVGERQDKGEVESFNDFVHAISATSNLNNAKVVVCSSAGGVYGASENPPFSVSSTIAASNPYGASKIAIEAIAGTEFSSSVKVHIARITNLYGPWPGPRQGLVNRMCTAAATRKALQIYVPLDTVRDYIYVDDAAELILLEAAAAEDNFSLSLIGSGENSSVGEVIKTVTNVTHRKVPISLAYLESTKLQPRDLRMTPSWRERGLQFDPMSLAEGVKRLFDSLITVPRWN